MVGIVERLVPDELWGLVQRVVPEAPSRPQGGGRRRHGDREVLAAIVVVATSDCTWEQLPSAPFGPSGATAHRRFSEWSKGGVWAKLHRLVLHELGVRGEPDWSRCAIDSVNMRALKRGPDRSESCRPGQVRLEDPPDHGTVNDIGIDEEEITIARAPRRGDRWVLMFGDGSGAERQVMASAHDRLAECVETIVEWVTDPLHTAGSKLLAALSEQGMATHDGHVSISYEISLRPTSAPLEV
ncbi:putative transposase of IS4/5 family DUF4096 [Streptomyces sp. 840.1]|nr:putative transposase of IS4/5 family DUF4096 [Streptomyces sp. 840.1]